MPLYQYHCPDCNKEFEKRAKMSDRGHKQECPTCGKKSERRAVTKFAAMVGGGGSGSMEFSGEGCGDGACMDGPSMAGTCCGGGSCVH